MRERVTSAGLPLRRDVQGLRAVAVVLVLAYHLAPDVVPGGFVGVDVFFVISGFLITSHLVAHPPRGAGDLGRFWAGRIRRLLPAALLVLVATTVATRLFLPETTWERGAEQTRAAMVYLVNWVLAGDAVDYLAADRAVTGVHHYWSLAVEEQFYLVWPVLVMAAGWLALRLGRGRRTTLAAVLGLVVATSFAWSVHLTAVEPGRAYFVTTTRVWELAAGGLLAVLLGGAVRQPSRVRPAWLSVVAAWAGLGAVVAAAFTFDADTAFPGPWALLPVLGTVAVVWAEPARRAWTPGGLLGLAPVQWVGDHSYSIYLWHWPLLTVATTRVVPMEPWALWVVLVATLVLAALTKRLVEDPFRTPAWRARPRTTYAVAAVATAAVVALSSVQTYEVAQRRAVDEDRLAAVRAELGDCFGAGALDADRECAPFTGRVAPSPVRAATDASEAYNDVGGRNCMAQEPDFDSIDCSFGDGGTTVALVGNSHAGQWLPALQELARQRGWRITTHLASRCATVATDLVFSTERATPRCRAWVERTVRGLAAEQPDLVVLANRVSLPAVDGSYVPGYVEVLEQLDAAGLRVVALEDTPAPGLTGIFPPDCLATWGEHATQCNGTRAQWIQPNPDPVRAAVHEVDSPRLTVLDPNDWICEAEACRAVVGGVVVYYDGTHLTATYARTLAAPLERALVEVGALEEDVDRG